MPPLVDPAGLERFLERVPEADRAFYIQLARRTYEPEPPSAPRDSAGARAPIGQVASGGFVPRDVLLDDPELEAEWRAVFRPLPPVADVDPHAESNGSAAGPDVFELRFPAELDALRRTGAAGGVVGSTFVHRVLGIAFTCPPGWALQDLRELQRAAMGRRMNSRDDFVNQVLNLAAAGHVPLVVVAAPVLDDPSARLGPEEIAPAIAINIEEPSVPATESGFDLLATARNELILFGAHLEDYRVLQRPERTTLSGRDAVTCCAAYTMLHANTDVGCPVRDRTYYVQRGPAIYSIHMVDYPERDPRLAFDFTSVVESMCFSSRRGVFAH